MATRMTQGAEKAPFEGCYMASNRTSSCDGQTAGTNQVFPQLGLKMLSLFEAMGVQRVFELDDKARAFRDGVLRRR